MKGKKFRLVFSFLLLLMLVAMNHKTVDAEEISQTSTVKVYDKFDYEYEGITLRYYIKSLPTDTNPGTVGTSFLVSNPIPSIELHIPATVSYGGISFTVTDVGTLFQGNKQITSLYLPDTISKLSYGAFANCTSLTEVSLPDSMTYLGYAAFEGCINLKTVKLPSKLIELGFDVFNQCTSLVTISLPEGLTTISPRAFSKCTSLESLQLPNSLTRFEAIAFSGSSITFIVDPDSYVAYLCKKYQLPCTYQTDVLSENITLDDVIMKKSKISLHAGKSETLSLLFYPTNTTQNKTTLWRSSDTTIAIVDENGMVTALKPGITSIIAKVGNKTARCTVAVTPYAPRSVKAQATGMNRIKISWSPVYGATEYVIYRATSDGKFTYWNRQYGSTSIEDINVYLNTTYHYKVYALTEDSGRSNPSQVVSAQPKFLIPSIDAYPISTTSIKLRWDGAIGANGYLVYRSESKLGPFKLHKKVTSSYITDSSLTEGKTYYYYVKAYYKYNNKTVFSEITKTVSAVGKTPPKAKNYITLGSSRAEVHKILGRPQRTVYFHNYIELYYIKEAYTMMPKIATIYMEIVDGHYAVNGWNKLFPEFKVSDGYESNTGTFSLGSTWNQVAKAMPTPETFELVYGGSLNYNFGSDYIFIYDTLTYPDGSTITFDDQLKVIGWENKGMLKVKYGSGTAINKVINLGTSLTDVVQAYGTPDKVSADHYSNQPKIITYGNTNLYFNEYRKLVAWDNKGKINITIGIKEANAPRVNLGDSIDDIIKAMGTPITLTGKLHELNTIDSLQYDKITYGMDENQRVSSIKSR